MCCHVSNKTAYAEEVQLRAESMEPENNATNAKHDDNVPATSGLVKGVEKKRGSPSYSHSSARSEDEDEIYEEPPKKTVEEPPKKSPTNAVTNTVKPVEKKDGSPSYSPSPPKSQDGEKVLEGISS